MEQLPVRVLGVDLVAEQPRWRRARLLREGEELPRDRWGNYLLDPGDGVPQRLATGYALSKFSPTVLVKEGNETVLVRPPSKAGQVLWVLVVASYWIGILMRGFLIEAAVLVVAILMLSRTNQNRKIAVSLLILGVATAVQVFWAVS